MGFLFIRNSADYQYYDTLFLDAIIFKRGMWESIYRVTFIRTMAQSYMYIHQVILCRFLGYQTIVCVIQTSLKQTSLSGQEVRGQGWGDDL